jgi:predicted amidohydrolase
LTNNLNFNEVIIHSTLTNTINRNVELAITRSSVITNQCYFFDINTAKFSSIGQSVVIGPCGEIIHQAGETQETFVVDIDITYVACAAGWALDKS